MTEAHQFGEAQTSRRTVIVAITHAGTVLGRRLAAALDGAELWTASRFVPEAGGDARTFDDGRLAPLIGELFPRCDGLVLICALGAAVRLVAPHLRDKRSDPAVVVVDDAGRFAVCAASGHVGGGNRLAQRVADVLGATAVITTASEAHGLPAADLIGQEYGWKIERPEQLTRLAAAMVNGDPVGLYQDCGERNWHAGALPPHILRFGSLEALRAADLRAALVITDRLLTEADERPGVVIYRPRTLAVGIGCSRGATAEEIAQLVETALRGAGLSASSVRALATADLKRDEAGLLTFAEQRGLSLQVFPVAQLDDAPGQQTPSAVVRAAVGTRGVCEPAALLAAGTDRLLVPKRKSRTVTVAVARVPGCTSEPARDTTAADPEEGSPDRNSGTLYVVGIGPGSPDQLTVRAQSVLQSAEVIVGYQLYLDLLRAWLPQAHYRPGSIGEEAARAREALVLTRTHARVALVGSGDAGIYGLAGLVHEVRETLDWGEEGPPSIEVIPGVTAAVAAAALLGAPLGHDFAAVSLSDLLTPWNTVARRIEAAAAADFVLALYNPTSQRRGHRFAEALAIVRQARGPETPVGIVTNAYRDGQSVVITNLASVESHPVNMLSTLIIGNSQTRIRAGRLVTPRGYTVTTP